jgi:hypothetical protein
VISYRPGSWFGIVGEHATVLLPPSEKARAGALWALVDDGAGFDEVLDALVSDGLRALPGFVLLSDDDDATRVVVRGPSKVSFVSDGGDVVVEGSASATWVERSLAGVTGVSVVLEEVEEPLHTLHGGLVRLAALVSPAQVETVQAPAPVAAPEPAAPESAPAASEASGPYAAVLPFPEPVLPPPPPAPPAPSAPAAEEGASPQTSAADGPDEDDDLDVPSWASASNDPLAAPMEDESWADEPTGVIPMLPADEPGEQPAAEPPTWTPPAPAMPAAPLPGAVPPPPPFPPVPPVPPVPTPPAPPSVPSRDAASSQSYEDHDGLTRAGAGEETVAQPVAPAAASQAVARLEFSHGERVDVDRVIIIGRAPESGRFSMTEQPLLVTVPSPHQEISSTHVEVRPGSGADHGAAVVTDLGSTNGTVVVQPGMGPEELRPGVPVQLAPGALIDLGDGMTIRVSQP